MIVAAGCKFFSFEPHGARTAAQLRGSLTVEDCTLPAEIVAALDDVSSGKDLEPAEA